MLRDLWWLWLAATCALTVLHYATGYLERRWRQDMKHLVNHLRAELGEPPLFPGCGGGVLNQETANLHCWLRLRRHRSDGSWWDGFCHRYTRCARCRRAYTVGIVGGHRACGGPP